MDKIICLVGESGSGKSTIAELLEKEGYNYIQSYTTRKPRFEGEKGHIFVDKPFCFTADGLDLTMDTIAYTFFDGNHYWATREQYKGKGVSIYVVDVEGVKKLRECVKDAEIVVIYLKVDERNRFWRMWYRSKDYSKDYLEGNFSKYQITVNNRIDHDREAFKVVPTNYTLDSNRPVEEVLEDVKKIIEGDI